MDKTKLEARLKALEDLRASHQQDVNELNFCIDGIKSQLSEMPDELPATPNN